MVPLNEISTSLFGVPLTVLGMSAAGAFASFAYGKSEMSRKRLFVLAVVNTLLGAFGVAVLPAWLKWAWVTPTMQPPIAGLLAFFSRWTVPLVIEMAPQWVRGWVSSVAQKQGSNVVGDEHEKRS